LYSSLVYYNNPDAGFVYDRNDISFVADGSEMQNSVPNPGFELNKRLCIK
jgi:hypothetical protein